MTAANERIGVSVARTLVWALFALLVARATPVSAYPYGYFGGARSPLGCSCHGFPVVGQPTPTTRLFVYIDGELAEDFPGYVPGGEHTIELWVIGLIVPFAGFNLDVTAGTLSASDGSAEVRVKTECGRMSCVRGAPNCGVKVTSECSVWESGNSACKRCTPSSGDATCRLCDDTDVLESEATHTAPAPVPSWTFTWRPPAEDVGPVKLYAVGNSVSGEGRADIGDMWNFLEPNPIVIEPAP